MIFATLSLCLFQEVCHPPLISFGVHREALDDGWTHSTGGMASDTRVIEVDYYDNRAIAETEFTSQGQVTLTNTSHGFMPENRKIKYRHKVQVPRGDYVISQSHSPHDYEVCAANGEITFYTEKILPRQDPYVQEWAYTVEIQPWGDLNSDGRINGGDLGLLFGDWGLPGDGDLNEDGITDGEDLAILLENWNDY
tara:strand:- start:9996 stop:10580 length:585 start_codon:yes stop_codon:yes gene_type:complete